MLKIPVAIAIEMRPVPMHIFNYYNAELAFTAMCSTTTVQTVLEQVSPAIRGQLQEAGSHISPAHLMT